MQLSMSGSIKASNTKCRAVHRPAYHRTTSSMMNYLRIKHKEKTANTDIGIFHHLLCMSVLFKPDISAEWQIGLR